MTVSRDGDPLVAWLDLVVAIGARERWSADEVLAAQRLLMEASAWKRGFRPPTSFREALRRARLLHGADRLSLGSGGL